MAVEKIVTLCKEGDSTTEYYPNIKADNIPVNAVAKTKLATELQNEIDGKAPQSTTYTKTEIDNKLSGKVNVATYNAKVSELETAIGTKANANDVYTKTATDTLLDAKANASDVYTKSQVYTKTESDALLSAKANSSDVFTKAETNLLLQNGYYNQTEIDLMLENKADVDDVYTKTATDTLLNGKVNKYTDTFIETNIQGQFADDSISLVLPFNDDDAGVYYINIYNEDVDIYLANGIILISPTFITRLDFIDDNTGTMTQTSFFKQSNQYKVEAINSDYTYTSGQTFNFKVSYKKLI